jgi:hypothetical protein
MQTESIDRSLVNRYFRAAFFLALVMISWSLSNPVGSTPDEYFTLGSIWCANGVDGDSCLKLEEGGVATNYAGGVAKIDYESCLLNIRSSVSQCSEIEPQFFGRNTGGYPNGMYKFMHLFTSVGGSLSIVLMRVVNSLIFVGLFLLQLILANPKRRISFLTALTFTLIPMSLFLLSSIHPSGWALTGVANGWLFLIVATTRSHVYSWKFWIAWLGWAICAGMCLVSRYEAFLYFIASNVITYLFTKFSIKQINWRYIALSATVLGTLFFLLLRFNQITKWSFQFPYNPQPGQIDNQQWISHWLLQTIAIPVEALGTGLVGQHPLRIPDIVWIVGLSVLGGALLFSFIRASLVQLLSFATSLLMLTFLILSLNGRQERDLFNLSGRYIIPLVPFIVGFCVYLSKSPVQIMQIRRLRTLIIFLLSITHLFALHSVVETYVDGQSFAFLPISVNESSWWWIGLPFGPNFVVLLGSICFIKFLSIIWSTVPTVEIEVRNNGTVL